MTTYSISAKDGIILAALTIAVNILTAASVRFIPAVIIVSMISLVLWVVKLIGSYVVLKKLAIKRNADGDRKSIYRYCLRTVFFSSLLCAAYMAFDLLVMNPDKPAELIQSTMQMYESMSLMDSNTMEAMNSLSKNLPIMATAGQFVWCMIFGLIYSSIISSAARKADNPFNNIGD